MIRTVSFNTTACWLAAKDQLVGEVRPMAHVGQLKDNFDAGDATLQHFFRPAGFVIPNRTSEGRLRLSPQFLGHPQSVRVQVP